MFGSELNLRVWTNNKLNMNELKRESALNGSAVMRSVTVVQAEVLLDKKCHT